MSISRLFSRLDESGIRLQLQDNQLKIHAPKGKLTPELVNELRDRKDEIIVFLKKHVQKPEKYEQIVPVEKKEYYPVSSAQKRLYILYRLNKESTVYNMPSVLELKNEEQWDKHSIEDTFRGLVYRHDSFRTSFEIINEEPVQRIKEEVEFKVEKGQKTEDRGQKTEDRGQKTEDRGQKTEDRGQKTEDRAGIHLSSVIRHLSSEFIRPFDLSRAPLLRVGMIPIEKEKYMLLVDMHHIISDGMSIEILIREFMALHQGDIKHALPKLRLQYKDYSEWQRQRNEKEQVAVKQQAYWLNEFAGERPILDLPYDYQRPGLQSFAGEIITFEFQNQEVCALNHLVKKENVTLFMILLSAFNILLGKLSGQEDIVIGTPIAGRIHPDLEPVIGMFVNTLALRNYPLGEKTFTGFLSEVKTRSLKAFENQDYPFETLVGKVVTARDAGRNPLFDIMFALHNISDNTGSRGKPGTYAYENRVARFDMTWMGTERGERIDFEIEYCTKLYKREAIERFFTYFKKIVTTVTNEPGIPISRVEIISAAEREQVLYDFNDTKTEYPRDKTIHALFKEQVQRTPAHIALVGPIVSLGMIVRAINQSPLHQITYKKLNESADRLAHLLIEKGVGPDIIVGIKMERSIEMIIGLLGILKAGGAYLPIDPNYPGERIDFMLKDSGAKVLLTGNLDLPPSTLPPFYPSNPSSLAYIIYTSGTTGRPKGVPVQHQNVVSRVKNPDFIDFTTDDRILPTGNIVFDISVFEIWWPLLNGLTLFLANQTAILNPEEPGNFIVKNRISILHLTPQLFNQLAAQRLEIFAGLRYFLVGGDLVTPHYVNLLRNIYKDIKILHMYGPTENTIFSTFHLVTQNYDTVIPIGKPLGNSFVYIVDKAGNLVPIGVPGELLTGGDGTVRGYLNKPELTKEKFCHQQPGALFEKTAPGPRKNFLLEGTRGLAPLLEQEEQVPGKRVYYMSYMSHKSYIYQTGDLARWLPDGNIEFLGRIDTQVKIRGFRIETGEIERCLLDIDYIKEAVVIAKDDNTGGKYLCAYVVPGQEVSTAGLKNILAKILPDYMLPSYFIPIKQIPLTPNGKINRSALPEPDRKPVEKYLAPGNRLEKKLLELWADVLAVEKNLIGIEHDFFQMGGHSLNATLLAARMQKSFNVKVPLAEIFKTPTIRGLAKYIKGAEKERYASIEPVENKEYYALSPAQKRLFILQQMEQDNIGYNIPLVIPFPGELDKTKLESVFQKLCQRYESLRTSFEMLGDKPVQGIHPQVDFALEVYEANETEAGEIIDRFTQPFDLSRAPLLRVGLIKLHTPGSILLVDVHHIITDGASMKILRAEFNWLYEGKGLDLNPLRLQYKDYACWQNSDAQQVLIKEQETYWLHRFADELPVMNLPTDYPRPLVQSFEGSTMEFELTMKETQTLKDLTEKTSVTLYMTILSVFTILLAKLSGQDDIIVGTPLEGRRHADLEKIIGMFVNTLALRNKLQGEMRYKEFLEQLKVRTLEAYENQEYQFEELVDKISVKRDTGRNPVFDVMFNLLNRKKNTDTPGIGEQVDRDEEHSHHYKHRNVTSTFDLTLAVEELEERLIFTFEYCTKLFKPDTIKRFIAYFKRLLELLAEIPDPKVADLEIITPEEKHQVLYEFNHAGTDYSKEKTILAGIAEQAERTPDNIALIGPGPGVIHKLPLQITYSQMQEKSTRMAHTLRQSGAAPETIVGIMAEPSVEMIIDLIGILKAGAAYLPIDPGTPGKRIDFMLKDSKAQVLVKDDRSYASRLSFAPKTLLNLSEGHHLNFPASQLPGFPASLPSSLAYIIYTSGSTGRPKGVMVEHRNLAAYINAFEQEFVLFSQDTVIQQASFTFDAFVEEIYPILMKGGKIAILPKDEVKDIDRIIAFIVKHRVTMISASPLLLDRLNKAAAGVPGIHIRICISGGDVLKKHYIDELLKISEVYNTYGPTETTVCTSYYRCGEKTPSNVPIGKPIADYSLYILDAYKQIQPIGIGGELCVSGPGVTRGYLNKPLLTAEKFDHDKNHRSYRTYILYKTGDLARWQPDGNIEFLGRLDQQAKIRGFRIELGEIETQLLNHEHIEQAVVTAQTSESGEKYLCAYVVTNQEIPGSVLRDYLEEHLPGYMIPSQFVTLEKMPYTVTGKIDRKALPVPGLNDRQGYIAPRTALEEKLAGIWTDVLGIKKDLIGIDSNFFQLGGHSLKATIILSRINKEFNTTLTLQDFFSIPTITGLVRTLGVAAYAKYESINPVEKKTHYPLSSAQKRLYFLHRVDPKNLSYNMPAAYVIKGKLDRGKFEEAIQGLIKRHETLRTSFDRVDDEAVQKIAEYSHIQTGIEYEKIPEKHEIDIKKKINEFVRPFDIRKAPLLRVELIESNEQNYFVLFDIHHIISDGISLEILIDDFAQLYKGKNPGPLSVQYKDYTVWQNNTLNEEKLENQENYWMKKLEGFVFTQVPPDHFETKRQAAGKAKNLEIEPSLYKKIEAFCNQNDVTIFTFMITVLEILLAGECDQRDITIGIPASIRNHPELKPLIGIFLNVLLIRTHIDDEDTFINHLTKSKQTVIDALDNQDYPYEMLSDKTRKTTHLMSNELFSILFNYYPVEIKKGTAAGDFEIRSLEPQDVYPKYDITLYVLDTGEYMELKVVYKGNIYDDNTIQGVLGNFEDSIRRVLENEDISAAGINRPEEGEYDDIDPGFEKYYNEGEL
jgi:tyrocidine synthetase-3